MAIKTSITVEAENIQRFKTDYLVKMQNMFTEAIHINPETCVYKQWETTSYASENQPFAKGMVEYSD